MTVVRVNVRCQENAQGSGDLELIGRSKGIVGIMAIGHLRDDLLFFFLGRNMRVMFLEPS